MNASVPPGTPKREMAVARTRKTDPKPAASEADALPEPRADVDAPADEAAAEVTLPQPEAEPAPAVARGAAEPGPREIVRIERRGGFFPLLLGGLIAGGAGFGAAAYVIPRYLPQLAGGASATSEMQAQADRIAALDSAIADLKTQAPVQTAAVPDDLPTRLDEMTARLSAIERANAAVADQITALDGRLGEIERRPMTGNATSAAALEAVNRELDGFRAEMAAQMKAAEAARTQIATAADAAAAKVATVESEAERVRTEAETAAKSAAVGGGVARILAALESGAAFDSAVGDVKAAGFDVPEALVSQAQGVPTLAALRDSFPEAARTALAVSIRDVAPDDAWSRIVAFFRSQSGARSLAPRAGDDPDAILSRAEASLRAGDLARSVEELKALPEPGQAVMAEWVAKAERRLGAVEASATLQQLVK